MIFSGHNEDFSIDFGEDRISLRIGLLHKERWREKNEDGRFQLYFMWNLFSLRIPETYLHMQGEGWFLTKQEMTSSVSEEMGRMTNWVLNEKFLLKKNPFLPPVFVQRSRELLGFHAVVLSPHATWNSATLERDDGWIDTASTWTIIWKESEYFKLSFIASFFCLRSLTILRISIYLSASIRRQFNKTPFFFCR